MYKIDDSGPLVSVIMNCYNCSNYLKESVESVLNQTYKKFEIIFWDNKSSDNSAVIFNSFKDKRLKYYLAQSHTTLGEARNNAVNKATGKWVGFLDCDDIWIPTKLENQVKIILSETSNLGLIYGQVKTFFSNNKAIDTYWQKKMTKYTKEYRYKKLPEGYIFNELIFENFIPMSSAILRKDIFKEISGINPILRQCEDYDLFLKIASSYRVRAVHDLVALYRVHDQNNTISQKKNEFEETVSLIRAYLPSSIAKKALAYHYFVEAYASLSEKNIKRFKIIIHEIGWTNLFKALVTFIILQHKRKFTYSTNEN
jgi:glycosyltransferase involved in cell wall biosynthesis